MNASQHRLNSIFIVIWMIYTIQIMVIMMNLCIRSVCYHFTFELYTSLEIGLFILFICCKLCFIMTNALFSPTLLLLCSSNVLQSVESWSDRLIGLHQFASANNPPSCSGGCFSVGVLGCVLRYKSKNTTRKGH